MSVCLYVCMPVCLCVCMLVCLYVCMSVCLSVPVFLSVSVCVRVCMYVHKKSKEVLSNTKQEEEYKKNSMSKTISFVKRTLLSLTIS